jgi:hypothetical protein
MTTKSMWLSAALIGAMGFMPAQADAQLRQSTTVQDRVERARQRTEAQRRGSIFDRTVTSEHKRSCAHLDKGDKARCKELRKREHRLAKLEKRRQKCLAMRDKNPSHPHCDALNGGWSLRDRMPDVIIGGADVRRPRGTDPALEQAGRHPRSGL